MKNIIKLILVTSLALAIKPLKPEQEKKDDSVKNNQQHDAAYASLYRDYGSVFPLNFGGQTVSLKEIYNFSISQSGNGNEKKARSNVISVIKMWEEYLQVMQQLLAMKTIIAYHKKQKEAEIEVNENKNNFLNNIRREISEKASVLQSYYGVFQKTIEKDFNPSDFKKEQRPETCVEYLIVNQDELNEEQHKKLQMLKVLNKNLEKKLNIEDLEKQSGISFINPAKLKGRLPIEMSINSTFLSASDKYLIETIENNFYEEDLNKIRDKVRSQNPKLSEKALSIRVQQLLKSKQKDGGTVEEKIKESSKKKANSYYNNLSAYDVVKVKLEGDKEISILICSKPKKTTEEQMNEYLLMLHTNEVTKQTQQGIEKNQKNPEFEALQKEFKRTVFTTDQIKRAEEQQNALKEA